MRLADRRWRVVALIPLALGILVIFVGTFTEEFGQPVGFPTSGVGGALIGLGVALIVVSRRAERDADNGGSHPGP